MIVNVFGKQVDTDWNYKQMENMRGHAWCSKDNPHINFTVEAEGFTQYVVNVFNKDGSELQEIYSWHQLPRVYKMVKKSKEREGCYFTKLEAKNKPDEEMVEEIDYDAPRYSEHLYHWKRCWGENDVHKTINTPITKNKKWGIF